MMKKKKPTIKKYQLGGTLEKAGELFANYGRGVADAALGTFGASNVIPDEAYRGEGAEFMNTAGSAVGSIGKAALPIAANMLLPGSGTAIKGAQMVGSQLNPQDQQVDQYGNLIPQGQFPNGGMVGMPLPEVEKQEVMRAPDGSTMQVDGPSHANGGVDVNLPAGTQVFSDRLKMPGTKKTFAKLAEKFKTNKEEKVLSDDKATNTAKATAKLVNDIKQKKLTELFNTQESLKQAKVAKYAQKMGLGAQQQQYAMGGKVCYPNGGMIYNPDGTYRFAGDNTPGAALDSFNSELDALNSQYSNTMYDTTVNKNEAKAAWFADTNNYDPTTGESSRSADMRFNERYGRQDAVPPVNNQLNVPNMSINTGNIDPNLVTTGASFLAQNAGNIYDLYKSNMGKDYDKVNYGKVNPSLLSDRQALIDADIQSKVSRGQIAGAVGGNAGAYLSNVSQVGGSNALNKARIRQDYQNQNAQITNQAKYFNKNLEVKGMEDEAANKGQTSTIARDAVRDIGYKAGAGINDLATARMDENTLKWISKMYPNYTFDKNKGWYFNSAGKPLEVK